MKQLMCSAAILGLVLAGAACSRDRTAGDQRKDNETLSDQIKGTAGEAYKDTRDAAETAAEKTKDAAETAGEKTKAAAETAAEKTKEGVSKTGEVITDAWITTKVKSQFMGKDALKGSDIDVDTTDHVVTLKGTVASQAGRAEAVRIARDTEGVKRVHNQLTIAGKK